MNCLRVSETGLQSRIGPCKVEPDCTMERSILKLVPVKKNWSFLAFSLRFPTMVDWNCFQIKVGFISQGTTQRALTVLVYFEAMSKAQTGFRAILCATTNKSVPYNLLSRDL